MCILPGKAVSKRPIMRRTGRKNRYSLTHSFTGIRPFRLYENHRSWVTLNVTDNHQYGRLFDDFSDSWVFCHLCDNLQMSICSLSPFLK